MYLQLYAAHQLNSIQWFVLAVVRHLKLNTFVKMISGTKLAFGACWQFFPTILLCAHNPLIDAIKALVFFAAIPAVILKLPKNSICTGPSCNCQHLRNAPTVWIIWWAFEIIYEENIITIAVLLLSVDQHWVLEAELRSMTYHMFSFMKPCTPNYHFISICLAQL